MPDVTTEHQRTALTRFNGLPAAGAQQLLLACCAASAWAAMVADGRPYASLDDLLNYSDAALATLTEHDIAQALAAHPRIGQRADGRRPDAIWSRQEQSRAATATATVQDALVAGNIAYERRFGRVFLICATGLSGEQVLAALRARLANDPDDERLVVRQELRKITGLRLRKLVRS